MWRELGEKAAAMWIFLNGDWEVCDYPGDHTKNCDDCGRRYYTCGQDHSFCDENDRYPSDYDSDTIPDIYDTSSDSDSGSDSDYEGYDFGSDSDYEGYDSGSDSIDDLDYNK